MEKKIKSGNKNTINSIKGTFYEDEEKILYMLESKVFHSKSNPASTGKERDFRRV